MTTFKLPVLLWALKNSATPHLRKADFVLGGVSRDQAVKDANAFLSGKVYLAGGKVWYDIRLVVHTKRHISGADYSYVTVEGKASGAWVLAGGSPLGKELAKREVLHTA